MRVKELRALLAEAKEEDIVVINVDGSVYPVDDQDTAEQFRGYLAGHEFGIHVDVNGCP